MPSSRIAGPKRKLANRSHYLRGKARASFQLPSGWNTLSLIIPIASTAEQQSRVKSLLQVFMSTLQLDPCFQAAGMHGPSLHKCHMNENAWILGTCFDSQPG